ncbi:hypothetical protein LguiB_014158 [Lonicera macranthoides]
MARVSAALLREIYCYLAHGHQGLVACGHDVVAYGGHDGVACGGHQGRGW